jgi:hypothetical protein
MSSVRADEVSWIRRRGRGRVHICHSGIVKRQTCAHIRGDDPGEDAARHTFSRAGVHWAWTDTDLILCTTKNNGC